MSEGSWPQDCIQRAFVEGAQWWQFHHAGFTMWNSDRRDAEAEAVKRYGEPGEVSKINLWPKGMGLLPEERYGHIELFKLCDDAGLTGDQRTLVWGISIGEKTVADKLISNFKENIREIW